MTFDIQSYQNAFWMLIGIFVLLLSAAAVTGLTYASRVMSARITSAHRTPNGRITDSQAPTNAFQFHKAAAIILLCMTAAMILVMFSLLNDSRINIPNEDSSSVLTVTGTLDAVEPRSIWDGFLLFKHDTAFTYGFRLTVDGTEYHTLSAGQMEEGDTVTLQYLPKSRFVLYIGDRSTKPFPAITPPEAAAARVSAMAAIPPLKSLTFPFADYQQVVTFEACLFGVMTVLLVRTVILSLRELVLRKMTAADGFKSLLFVFACILLLAVGCSSVWNGGWQLLTEKSSDAVPVQGKIQSIEVLESTKGVKFSTEWGTYFGCWFTIDEDRYFGMYEGDLAAGDTVDMTILPKSRYILSISAKEE